MPTSAGRRSFPEHESDRNTSTHLSNRVQVGEDQQQTDGSQRSDPKTNRTNHPHGREATFVSLTGYDAETASAPLNCRLFPEQ